MKLSNTYKLRFKARDKRGFALISTILVLSMLMLLSVSILSLSSVTTRTSGINLHQHRAEMNARMAAMLAVGELQQYLGPDQRVAANAAIYDNAPETVAIDGVENPYWLGVYKTTFGQDDKEMIYPESSAGGYLKDHRGNDTFKLRDNVLKFMVSGSRENDSTQALSSSADRQLIIKGETDLDNVYVPKVATENGGYAFHVKDIGMSAPIYEYNPNAGEAITATDEGNSVLYTGSHRPYQLISETSGTLDHIASEENIKNKATITKRFTVSQSEHSGNVDAVREMMKKYVHDLDLPAEALMVDPVRGGFKIDLTSYLKDKSAPGSGSIKDADGAVLLTDTSPIIDKKRTGFTKFSPKFGILRDFANIGSEISSGKITPRPPLMGSGKVGAYPSYENFTKMPVHPYITEFSVYVSVVNDSSSPTKLSMLVYPRVTLYNPHNVTLKASKYFVQINRRLTYFIRTPDMNADGGEETYEITDPYWYDIANDPATAKQYYLGFYLEPIEMEPGEALVFTPNTEMTRLSYLRGDITKNVLSARVSPDSRNAFFDYMKGRVPYDKNKGNGTYQVKRFWENGYHLGYGDVLSARLRLNLQEQNATSYTGNIMANKNFPIVHTLDAQSWARGNEGRWRDINKSLPIGDISNPSSVNPVNRTMLGMRLKLPEEAASNLINAPNGFWKEAIINNFNIRAGVHRRSPWDFVNSITTVGHEFAFGPYTTDNQEQPEWTSSFMKPSYFNGKYRYSPFLGSVGNGVNMPLFDLPSQGEEFYSIAQFRSAPLTQVFDHPSNIIGESIAPRSAPRGKSAHTKSDYISAWNNGLEMQRVTAEANWYDQTINPQNNIASYDVRYEANHALWDSYFISTYDKTASEDERLKNKRVIISEEIVENAADRIAQYVKLRGHLNVNTTSVLAWKSILMMNAGTDVGTQTTESEKTPFPNMIKSEEGSTDGSADSVANVTWNGYRTLTEQEADTLAEAIVAQVKKRAPFIGVGDFVNRRLKEIATPNADPRTQTDEQKMSYAGAIDVAILESRLNDNLMDYQAVYNKNTLSPASVKPLPEVSMGNQPAELFHGAAAHLSQGKILQTIGSSLTARSDTFKIRAYGESKDKLGNKMADATCELIVQRTPYFIDSIDPPETKYDDLSELNKKFGRKFTIVSFKWL